MSKKYPIHKGNFFLKILHKIIGHPNDGQVHRIQQGRKGERMYQCSCGEITSWSRL